MARSRARERWPRTVDEAVDRFLAALGAGWRTTLLETTREGAQRMNLSLGRWMRNAFGLWNGNRELLADCARLRDAGSDTPSPEDPHVGADEASALLLGVAWDRLRSEVDEDGP